MLDDTTSKASNDKKIDSKEEKLSSKKDSKDDKRGSKDKEKQLKEQLDKIEYNRFPTILGWYFDGSFSPNFTLNEEYTDYFLDEEEEIEAINDLHLDETFEEKKYRYFWPPRWIAKCFFRTRGLYLDLPEVKEDPPKTLEDSHNGKRQMGGMGLGTGDGGKGTDGGNDDGKDGANGGNNGAADESDLNSIIFGSEDKTKEELDAAMKKKKADKDAKDAKAAKDAEAKKKEMEEEEEAEAEKEYEKPWLHNYPHLAADRLRFVQESEKAEERMKEAELKVKERKTYGESGPSDPGSGTSKKFSSLKKSGNKAEVPRVSKRQKTKSNFNKKQKPY